ncbi:MAG: DUF4129 domain-containing protein [Euryarchaeota archaeon]|nr:DUF4129 domain-containing protein [Euryarchaeota archaeon]
MSLTAILGRLLTPLGLLRALTDSPFGALLVLIGIGSVLFSILVLVKSRSMVAVPATEAPVPAPAKKRQATPAPAATPAPTPPRPRATTDRVAVKFPAILRGHPDVWGLQEPIIVAVETDTQVVPPGTPISLALHRKGRSVPLGEARTDSKGVARFEAPLTEKGEADIIARLQGGQVDGQAVRPLRVVDYREEIVETFEDFKAWADSQFDFVDLRMTAREFVDRFADGRPGTPVAPLDRIVDIYELSNYSEHPVDRSTYTRMVEAFLELESAGALDGEESR